MLTFIASILIWLLYFGLAILWVIDGKVKKEQVIHALIAGIFSWILTFILKSLFSTPRPFEINGGTTDVLLPPSDGAFPSSHAALAMSLAVTIFLHDRKVGGIFLILAIAIGIARVLANVHYPVDILGGALVGTLVAILVEKIHFRGLISSR